MAGKRPEREKTVYKTDLIDMVSQRTKIPKAWVRVMLNATIETIQEELLKGHRVVLWKLCTFHLKERAPIVLKTRDPRGKRIPRRKVPAVTFAPSFKKEIIKRFSEK